MNKKCLMFQGTGSSVGKSLLVAAMGRILKQEKKKVAPFKSQNMALNSFITVEGDEMGRAQVVQAEACGILPNVKMNPILLKPTTDRKAQVIVKGKVLKNMSAAEYHAYKPELKNLVKEIYDELEAENDYVLIEGAGSPAEINLRENDLVNMGMAELADAPVLLIGDIDKGGVFASILGTIMLLSEEERARVKGVIINKFRGDIELLKPGIKMLEEKIDIPVIGVIPYVHLNIEDEDSVTETFTKKNAGEPKDLKIEIIRLPHISNFTDFNVLTHFPDVSISYVNVGEKIGNPDIVIIPGSKNTLDDLMYLKESGLAEQIVKHCQSGKLLLGICGGYQILGKKLYDPYQTESNLGEVEGLGLLDMSTIFAEEKVTTQVRAKIIWADADQEDSYFKGLQNEEIEGYEIHLGQNTFYEEGKPLLEIKNRLGAEVQILDGISNAQGNVLGTYIHGIFDNTRFTRKLLNNVRIKKGLAPIEEVPASYQELKEREYDRLAQIVRESIDMNFINDLLA